MKQYNDIKSVVAELERMQSRMAAYNHATGMLYFDSVTVAPKGTIEGRGRTMGILTEEGYTILVNEDTPGLLEYLKANEDQLEENTKLQVKELKEDFDKISKIPMDEYVEYNMLINEAQSVWHDAKQKSDYSMFQPYLEKIVNTVRKFANYLDPSKKPYDVWLNEYEKGLTMEIADTYFETIKKELVPTIQKVVNSKVT
ncbi:MAG TPA: carboxypeptidase M32, partial [Clostridia bacterium]|nr:carboxypeptidase M32 [Clostridia bacterium]